MNTLKFIFAFLIIISWFSCSNQQNDYQEKGPNFYFKLLSFGEDSTSIGIGKLVQFSWSIQDEDSNIIFQDRLFIKIDSTNQKPGIIQSLCLLKKGDKGAFKFPLENLEPSFISRVNLDNIHSKNLVHIISIDNVLNEDEFSQNKKEFLDWVAENKVVNYNSIEQQVIENYIETNKLNMQRTETGLRIQVFKNHSGQKPSYGQAIKIRYQGGVLGQSNQHFSTEQDFHIGEEMQVIKAIEEAILLMEMGDSCFIIAPPSLAFGEQGSSTGLIPPASIVSYHIKLLDGSNLSEE